MDYNITHSGEAQAPHGPYQLRKTSVCQGLLAAHYHSGVWGVWINDYFGLTEFL